MASSRFFFLLLFISAGAFAQISPTSMHQVFLHDKPALNIPSKSLPALKRFYERMGFKTAWLSAGAHDNKISFFNTLKSSADWGLRPGDYEIDFIEAFIENKLHLQSTADSIEAEVRFTNIAIRFYSNMAFGNTEPLLGYNGLDYTPGCLDIVALLADHIQNGQLILMPMRLSGSSPEVSILEKKIRDLNKIITGKNFKEMFITSGKVKATNGPLVSKLFQLGLLDSADSTLADRVIKEALKESQRQFGLIADGVLRSTILQALNTPLTVRLQQLNLAVNYYRWLHCLIQQHAVIVVNIPAAYMKVYRGNRVILEMKMVLGNPLTPTPMLASKVTEVILYPYWHVPYSIATKELLPHIKKNPGYLDAGNYQVLNQSGKIIDPYTINWNGLSTRYFPYLIRQSTGCDNALGLIKLNFYSPFGVYLHDTPFKSAFGLNKRYFSHGCLRMENPMALAHLVLKNNPLAIDTLEQKGCLRNQYPITVKADEQMPVIVWYNPAGIDSTGRVLYFEDAYKKFDWMKKK